MQLRASTKNASKISLQRADKWLKRRGEILRRRRAVRRVDENDEEQEIEDEVVEDQVMQEDDRVEEVGEAEGVEEEVEAAEKAEEDDVEEEEILEEGDALFEVVRGPDDEQHSFVTATESSFLSFKSALDNSFTQHAEPYAAVVLQSEAPTLDFLCAVLRLTSPNRKLVSGFKIDKYASEVWCIHFDTIGHLSRTMQELFSSLDNQQTVQYNDCVMLQRNAPTEMVLIGFLLAMRKRLKPTPFEIRQRHLVHQNGTILTFEKVIENYTAVANEVFQNFNKFGRRQLNQFAKKRGCLLQDQEPADNTIPTYEPEPFEGLPDDARS